MPIMQDVFTQDAFSFVNVTEAVNEIPFIESRLGELGLFNGLVEGVETDTIAIDMSKGVLQILETSERGAPPQRAKKNPKANSRTVHIPHLEFEDRITAASLFGKRKPGTTMLESVADKINERFAWMLNFAVAPTYEVHRLNALRGILLDADGSVIEDFFNLFGVAQQTHDYAFSNASTDVRDRTHKALRKIEDYLDGLPFVGVRAICGRNFYDSLVAHPNVRETFLNFQDARDLRDDKRKTGFSFGGVEWEEYRGLRNLSVPGLGTVDDDEAIMFPVGVPGMYRTYYAPGDYLETVNQLGQQFYAKVAPDFKYNRHVDQLVETNPLFINTRPRAVLKVTAS